MEGQKAQPREHYLQKNYTNKSDVEDLQILTAARLDSNPNYTFFNIKYVGEAKVVTALKQGTMFKKNFRTHAIVF